MQLGLLSGSHIFESKLTAGYFIRTDHNDVWNHLLVGVVKLFLDFRLVGINFRGNVCDK
jgi:hypothetical protein